MTTHAVRLTVAPLAVSMRPLERGDGDRVRRWMEDEDLLRMTVLVPSAEFQDADIRSPEAAERYLELLLEDPSRRSFAVLVEHEHIGNMGFKDLMADKPEAECFIEIGEAHLRGRGVGTHAMKLLLELGFGVLGLQAVTLGVFEFNHPAVRMYSRLGFHVSGHYGWHWAGGRWHEVLSMRLELERFRALKAHGGVVP